MRWPKLKYKDKYFVIMVLLVIVAAMWVLDYFTPAFLDDYYYRNMFIDGSFNVEKPIESFKDILISQYYHYFGYINGRFFVHIIVQLFAGILGKSVFNVFNAIAFAAFVYLLTRMTSKVNVINIMFSSAVIFLLYPQFNLTVLWMSGGVNYVWASIIICLFIMLFERLRTDSLHLKHFIWLIPSVIAGWTNEGITFPLAISLVIYWIINYKTIRYQAVLPLIIGFVIGALFCAFAPSTIGRAGLETDNILMFVIYRIYTGIRICVKLRAIWILLLTLLIVYFIKKKDFQIWFKSFYLENMILWNAMLLSFGIVFISGLDFPRIGIGVELFSVVLWLRVVVLFKPIVITTIKTICCLCGIIVYIVVAYYARLNFRENERIIAVMKNDMTVNVIPAKQTYPKYLTRYIINNLYPIPQLSQLFPPDCGWVSPRDIGLYNCGEKFIINEDLYNEIVANGDKFIDIRTQNKYYYWVLSIDSDVNIEELKPMYVFYPLDLESLPFYIRPFASKLDRYKLAECPVNMYFTIEIGGRNFLFVGKNHNKIDERIKEIRLK